MHAHLTAYGEKALPPLLANGVTTVRNTADLPGWVKALDYMGSLDADAIILGHGPVSGKKDLVDMKEYLITFDSKAKELAASSNDIGFIVSELKKSLPQRTELDFLIGANVQARYLIKSGE